MTLSLPRYVLAALALLQACTIAPHSSADTPDTSGDLVIAGGGLIAINQAGEIVMSYNSLGMKRGSVTAGTAPQISVFD